MTMLEELEAMIDNELDRTRALQVTGFAEVTALETELLSALRHVRDVERRLEFQELANESGGRRLAMLVRARDVATKNPGLVRREDTGYSVHFDGDCVFIADPEPPP